MADAELLIKESVKCIKDIREEFSKTQEDMRKALENLSTDVIDVRIFILYTSFNFESKIYKLL